MKKILVRLLIGIVCVGIAAGLIKLSENVTSKEEIKQYEEFCENSIKTEGFLNNEYKETSTKISKAKIKSYTYTYSFYIGNVEYKAEYTTNSTKPKLTETLWYNSNNPEENSFTNPCEYLKKLKGKTNFGNKNLFLISGLIIGLIGLGIAWSAIKGMIVLGLRKLLKR